MEKFGDYKAVSGQDDLGHLNHISGFVKLYTDGVGITDRLNEFL